MTIGAAPLTEHARAKVNLYLHVLGRRADGYHELDSLVVFAGIGDTLRAAPAAELSLSVDGPFAAALAGEGDNLVLRAARALADAHRVAPGAALTLTKALPVASGIGGGSADAAAALRLLARLWRLPADSARMQAIARGLGADLPVCLAGGPAFIGGIGERLDSAPALPAAGLVLVNPGGRLATPAVFQTRAGPFSTSARFDDAPRDAAALAELLRDRRNDLADAARRLVPAIDAVLAALTASPDCLLARLSGSGATCFGLYDDAAAAAKAAAWLGGRRPGWWIAPTVIAAGDSPE